MAGNKEDEDFQTSMLKMAEDVSAIRKTTENIEQKFDNINKEINELKTENADLKSAICDLYQENKNLKLAVNQLEQYSRKNNIIINGIPTKSGENVRELVTKLGNKLNVSIHVYEIGAAHRLPGGKDNIQPIIARFNNSEIKDNMIKSIKRNKITAKDLGLDSNSKIFISEHLTRENMIILQKAKEMKYRDIFKFAWSRNGNVFVRINEDSQAIKIRDLEHLVEIEKEKNKRNANNTEDRNLEDTSSDSEGEKNKEEEEEDRDSVGSHTTKQEEATTSKPKTKTETQKKYNYQNKFLRQSTLDQSAIITEQKRTRKKTK